MPQCPGQRDQSSGSHGEIRKDGRDGRSAGEELWRVVSNFAVQQEAGGWGAGGLGAAGRDSKVKTWWTETPWMLPVRALVWQEQCSDNNNYLNMNTSRQE